MLPKLRDSECPERKQGREAGTVTGRKPGGRRAVRAGQGAVQGSAGQSWARKVLEALREGPG